MKRYLFCLLALAAFAAANTCTKAWYEIHAFNFLSIKDAPHLDSIYYREQPAPEEVHEWYQKYYYRDGLIHHSVFKFRDNDPVDNRIYLSADEVTLTNNLTYKKQATGFSVAIFNDTFLREFVMEVPEVHTTAVQRRDDAQKSREQSAAQSKRRPANISPRARYFDLLGRYKRAKIR